MKESLKKAILEFLRVIVLAAIPVLISQLEAGKIDWRAILVIIAIAGLRFVDKYLHELGKETGDEKLLKGLTRF